MNILCLVPSSKYSRNVARDLVYGCWCKGKRIGGITFPPLSLLSVATVLHNSGFNISLRDMAAEGLKTEDLRQEAIKSALLIILTSTMTFMEDVEIIKELKTFNPKLKTVAFGGHVTSEPEQSLRKGNFDFIVLREAEYAIRELAVALNNGDSFDNLKGIACLKGDKFITTGNYPLIQDLDRLPIPDRSMLPPVSYFNPVVKKTPYTTMFTSRGCFAECSFCASPGFYGKKYRMRSAKKVLEEMAYLSRLGFKEIFFRDEIFTASRKRVEDICRGLIEAELKLSWICSSRIESVDEALLQLMKKAGCHMIRFGVESGDDDILKNIDKKLTVEEIRNAFKASKNTGIDTHAHVMIGAPGETRKSIFKTFKLLKEILPTIITVGILTPYPGTPIFAELKQFQPSIEDGTDLTIEGLHTDSFYNNLFTGISEKELSRQLRFFYRNYYINPKYIKNRLLSIKSFENVKQLIRGGLNILDFSFKVSKFQ